MNVLRQSESLAGAEFHFDSIKDRRRKGHTLNHSGRRLYETISVELSDKSSSIVDSF